MTYEEFFDIGRVAYITGNVQEALVAKQALETVVESANSLQQLKAEIAALESRLCNVNGEELADKEIIADVCAELRQLSAV
jgi:hypothetical protein